MPDKYRINWIIRGDQYGKEKQELDERSPGINVWEVTRSVSMDDGDRLYGEPIDAQYAIYFIRNLWAKLDEKVKRWDETLQGLEKLYPRFKEILDQTNQSEETKGEIQELATTFETRIKKDHQWLINLLRNSCAITFDKSPLLKTLSQPRCEGIRFYLCLTDHYEGHESAAEEEHEEGEKYSGKLSLVTVGVDKDGKDLHYEYDPGKHISPEIPNIENRSMCLEYPSIKGCRPSDPAFRELEPYVLYKYAMPTEETNSIKS